ncbi:ABC transporter ATP-binding protein [Candidatus Micrarchaeota archaeon]|nr:ABC transporter ATP-binding protein [Candidatus Micrarchaeota archaeon]
MKSAKKKEKVVLELNDVWKTYTMGEVRVDALRGLSMKVMERDYLSVMGPSGSGKSTLLHMVGLLDVPTKGKVFIDGEQVKTMSDDERAVIRSHKIGFVFQVFNLVPSLTALENVALPLMIQGVPRAEREKKAEAVLVRIGMGARVHHKPAELSGGERQRVAIARALATDPAIILADEPTGNLDSKTGQEIIDLLDELNDEGRTIIVVTHDKEIAARAEKRMRLKDGQVISKS